MAYFAAALKYGGVYVAGPDRGKPFPAGDPLKSGGRVVIAENRDEMLDAIAGFGQEIVELDALPERHVSVKVWLKGD